jgi:hypothetical protein
LIEEPERMIISDRLERRQMVLDTIDLKPAQGIPTGMCHIMQHDYIEKIAGAGPGDYRKNPDDVYIRMLRNLGTDILDQYLADNPLCMGDHGFEGGGYNATTGQKVVLDGVVIDSPEDVAEHIEDHALPRLRQKIQEFDEDRRVREILEGEKAIQDKLGESILKTGYEFVSFPMLDYFAYGYQNYFMAFALYPDIIEKHFSIQADLAVLNNKAAARAYREGKLPPLYRLDHDMADSRGTLVNIKDLDRIWFPHFARSLGPMLETGVRMIWHCDGNLSEMVPRLIDVGIKGFQGFQYEDGMDYESICKMKTKDKEGLVIMGGVSVTRTLPFGTPGDVRNQIKWLVESGPETGLILACSSSLAPGVPWQNIETMIEGFRYYRTHRH